MEENTQVKISLNEGVDWKDPKVHAERALAILALLDEENSTKDSLKKKLRKEIENLYHSFYRK